MAIDQETTEVRETESVEGDTNVQSRTVKRASSTSGVVVAQRVIWYVAGVIIVLLALRVVLLLLAANQGSGFVDFVYSLSNFFAMPFYGIFSYEPSYGKSVVFEISSVVAIAIYALIAWGLAKLITLARPQDEI